MSKFIQIEPSQFKLRVKVQPGSSKNHWGTVVDEKYLPLKIMAPPVGGVANGACIKFLAKEFKTSKSQVTILSGKTSRYKTFLVENYTSEKLDAFLEKYLPANLCC